MAAELLAEASVVAERTGVDRTDYEVMFGPSNVVMQSVDVAVVTENYARAAEVARRMPRDSALPLAARSATSSTSRIRSCAWAMIRQRNQPADRGAGRAGLDHITCCRGC